jgi:hypothetical protein
VESENCRTFSNFNSHLSIQTNCGWGDSGGVVHGEIERISQVPTQRVKELMPQMASRVAELEVQVKAYLVMIGFAI